jgi:hypothetical protein
MRFPPNEPLERAAAEREYRIAFEEFSQQARIVQLLIAQPNPDRAAVDAAFLGLKNAHLAYTNRRNILANFLLPPSTQDRFPEKIHFATGECRPHQENRKTAVGSCW